MARGLSQKKGIDYEETFTLVARYTTIRSVLSLVAVMKWKIHQMYVKTAFLNGVVEEEVYVERPLGFETHDRESHVCRLKKALYGLNRHPGHRTTELTAFYPVWALPRVKQIPTFTTRLNKGTQ